MPNLTVLGDTVKGNIQSGLVSTATSGATSAGIPIASMNDDVLVWGITVIPPTGVREVISIPTKFTPAGNPIEWYIMEYGTIQSGASKVTDKKKTALAFFGSSWQSSHYSGTVEASSQHTAL